MGLGSTDTLGQSVRGGFPRCQDQGPQAVCVELVFLPLCVRTIERLFPSSHHVGNIFGPRNTRLVLNIT